MIRILILSLLAGGSFALCGCVAGMAVGAAGMAVRAAQPKPESNEHLRPDATQACSEQAAQHGTVRIIDVTHPAVNRIVVYGTVDDGKQRRSFECAFGTKVTSFKLRDIKAAGSGA